MKNLIVLLTLLLPLAIIAQEKGNKNEKASFEVSGNCEMCKMRIEKAAFKVKGVKMATWDIPSNIMSVVYDSNKVPLEALQEEIAKVGHDTPLVKAENSIYDKLPMCCLYKRMP
ncbi:heavy-metal-associated domain-containing protein [Flavobacteriaceae bacterium]|jgi:mercuric ion binding protein|nr:heavy-metal-associated domain-containing protein [Flavobacteriaceae bacterium]MBT5092038.1 heavy-metal-associated domain-containing protein [Flavobacteriaceae bacterium]MBT5283961.1 heavy-metal-associated domain-containing protein [Flavobacteriaceae bacterium]MBT5445976.1 heavy-metal-associated domain-containing protein [Flavobacteriaceae bacterium]MBT5694025.1 heavy-metal-associated domain-containing protein [Flavobacteriaceae bacterium]